MLLVRSFSCPDLATGVADADNKSDPSILAETVQSLLQVPKTITFKQKKKHPLMVDFVPSAWHYVLTAMVVVLIVIVPTVQQLHYQITQITLPQLNHHQDKLVWVGHRLSDLDQKVQHPEHEIERLRGELSGSFASIDQKYKKQDDRFKSAIADLRKQQLEQVQRLEQQNQELTQQLASMGKKCRKQEETIADLVDRQEEQVAWTEQKLDEQGQQVQLLGNQIQGSKEKLTQQLASMKKDNKKQEDEIRDLKVEAQILEKERNPFKRIWQNLCEIWQDLCEIVAAFLKCVLGMYLLGGLCMVVEKVFKVIANNLEATVATILIVIMVVACIVESAKTETK